MLRIDDLYLMAVVEMDDDTFEAALLVHLKIGSKQAI